MQRSNHIGSQRRRSDYHSRGGTPPSHIKQLCMQTVKSIRNSHRDDRRITLLLTEFCSSMIKISGEKGLTYIQISALSHSTAVVWAAADSAMSALQTEQQQCCRAAQSCLSQLLPKIVWLLPKMRPQQAANILWAFAKCGLHPDALVPGVATDLLHRVADSEHSANAQDIGNSVWAVATMQGDQCLSSATQNLIVTLCCQFLVYTADLDHQDSAKPQEVANVLWGLATLQYAPHFSVLDRLCAYMVLCVTHPSAKLSVQPQHVSNALWALYQLHHVPQLEQVTTLLSHISSEHMQPKPQAMSNTVLAFAGFGMQSLKADVQTLALGVMDKQHSTIQGLCNVAWGLAVLDMLTVPMFTTILDRVHGKLHGGTLRLENRRQLYQALYHLQLILGRDPAAHTAWQAAEARILQCTRGVVQCNFTPYNVDLNKVLEELELCYSRDELLRNTGHAAALLHSIVGVSRPIMVTMTAQADCATNDANRLLGPAASRRQVLGRHAELVCIPREQLNKEYVKATLEELTGLPLHTAFANPAAYRPGRQEPGWQKCA